MFKIGKRREASETSLSSRLQPRLSNVGDDDGRSSGGSDMHDSRPATPEPALATPEPALATPEPRRARAASFLNRIRPRSDTTPVSSSPQTAPQDLPPVPLPRSYTTSQFLTVEAGRAAFSDPPSSMLDDKSLVAPTMDSGKRFSNASVTSLVSNGSKNPPPSLTLQKSSPNGSEFNVVNLTTPVDARVQREASNLNRDFTDYDRTPTTDTASPFGMHTAAENGRSSEVYAVSRQEPTRSLSQSSKASSVLVLEGHKSAAASERKYTVSSLSSDGKSKADKKNRTPSGGSSGIAGALALSGIALATPSTALVQPRVLKTQPSPIVPSEPTRRTSHDGSHLGDVDSVDQMNHYAEGDYEALLSMDALGTFDEVMSQLGTGYAVASSKRNADFHTLFPTIPQDDYLIEDYGCALQRDILVQGRIYVSEHHLCFNANIFGWVTSLVIPFAEVIAIEKRMTALIIPNAIQIITPQARHTFASFLSRDSTYDLMANIWRISHPSASGPSLLESPEVHDGDATWPSDDKKKGKSPKKKKGKHGAMIVPVTEPNTPNPALEQLPNEDEVATENHKPNKPKIEHATTTCACHTTDSHLKNVAMNATFPTTPEKLYNLIYQSGFTKRFWAESQKLTEIHFTDWSPGELGGQLLKRNGSYVMPLNAPMGPKSTKCVVTDQNEHVDFDQYIVNVTHTKTPDVPGGSGFVVLTRTCISWAPKNQCRLHVTTQVEWTKVNRFIRGIVESSSVSGQLKYHQALDEAIRKEISEHRSEFQDEEDVIDATSTTSSTSDPVKTGQDLTSTTSPHHETTSMSSPLQSKNVQVTSGESNFQKLIDISSDMIGGTIETLMEQSPMMMGAIILVFILLIFNVWTFTSSSSSRHTLPSPPALTTTESAREVALAVREVLNEYFQHGQPPSTFKVPLEQNEGGNVEDVVMAMKQIEEMTKLVEGLEIKMNSVKEFLRQVQETSLGQIQ